MSYVLYVSLTGGVKYSKYLKDSILNLSSRVVPYLEQSAHLVHKNSHIVGVLLVRTTGTHPQLPAEMEFKKYLDILAREDIDEPYIMDCLTWSVIIKDHALLLKYIQEGAKVRTDDDLPITVAADMGDLEALRLLVANGANYHAHGEYCLTVAASNDDYEMVKYLLELDSKPYADNYLPLHTALKYGQSRLAELMLAKMPFLTYLEYIKYKFEWSVYKGIRTFIRNV